MGESHVQDSGQVKNTGDPSATQPAQVEQGALLLLLRLHDDHRSVATELPHASEQGSCPAPCTAQERRGIKLLATCPGGLGSRWACGCASARRGGAGAGQVPGKPSFGKRPAVPPWPRVPCAKTVKAPAETSGPGMGRQCLGMWCRIGTKILNGAPLLLPGLSVRRGTSGNKATGNAAEEFQIEQRTANPYIRNST